MRFTRLLFSALCIACITFPANAADIKPFTKFAEMPEFVNGMIQSANDNFASAKLEDGSAPSPLTPQEQSQGVIPVSDAKRVIDRGAVSAYAEWCGYNGESQSYMPFMAAERESGKWTDRQLAYMGVLHGLTWGALENNMESVPGGCKEKDKQGVENYLRYLQQNS